MAHRVTMHELETVVSGLNVWTENRYGFDLGVNYGLVRLERKSGEGSADVSGLMTHGQLREWIHGYVDGIHLGLEFAKVKGSV